MCATSHKRGWEIFFDHDKWEWLYSDTKESTETERPCKRCGKMPTKEGYDFCLGKLEGVSNACCGHGVELGYIRFK